MAVLILVQGCSIWEPVPLGRAHSQIEVGDTVRVTREDGFRKSFKVVGPIEDGIIRGERDSVSLEEVAKLERLTADREHSDEQVGVGVSIVAAIVAIIAAGSAAVFAF